MAAETPDPLPDWQPPPQSATTDVPDPLPQRKGVLDTSFSSLPTKENAGTDWLTGKPIQGPFGDIPVGDNITRLRQGASDTFSDTGWSSTSAPDGRSALPPGMQEAVGPIGRTIADLAGTTKADALTLLSGVGDLGTETMRALGLPESLIRDVNTETTRRAGEGSTWAPSPFKLPEEIPQRSFQLPGTPVGPFVWPKDQGPLQGFMEPLTPTPSLTDVAQTVRQQRNAALDAVQPPDPTSQAMIEYLTKRPWDANATPTIPEAPQPSTLAPGPAPAPPGGGLLNMQPPAPLPTGGLLGNDAPVMSQADMQSVAKGHYSPADEAKANGMRMTPAEGDAIRGPLVDAIPTDPQDVAHFNDTPLAGEANKVTDFVGQDMSIGTAMQIDRGLSRAIRATTDPTDKANLITAQNGVRDAMEQSPVFQSQPDARQAWSQSIKQGQIEDIEADVATRDENQQDARRRTLVGNLLRNDSALRSWSPDEVAELQQRYDQSTVGSLKQFGINLIKPITTATGAGLGAWMGGPTGGFIGSRIGEQGGDMLAAAARRRAMSIDLTPVSQRLTANMPPPPAGWQNPSP
jgi:hypothetical protein